MSSAGFTHLLSHRARRATRTLYCITVPQGQRVPRERSHRTTEVGLLTFS